MANVLLRSCVAATPCQYPAQGLSPSSSSLAGQLALSASPLSRYSGTCKSDGLNLPVTCGRGDKQMPKATSIAFDLPGYDVLERADGDGDEFYEVPVHTVKVHDRQKGIIHEFQVPEDQYILHTGEDLGIELPFACRHGCCTACAVRVKSGELLQPLALGISPELKEKGYALMCVGVPKSDLEVETQDEDEVYWLQFGRYFAKGPVERDDFALELAIADE